MIKPQGNLRCDGVAVMGEAVSWKVVRRVRVMAMIVSVEVGGHGFLFRPSKEALCWGL